MRLPGRPAVLCAKDVRGGTWLGVNSRKLLVAVTDRPTPEFDPRRRSRGLLCLDALTARSAHHALARCKRELEARPYNFFNLLCAGTDGLCAVHYTGAPEIWQLGAGVHFLANGDLNDFSIPKLARARSLLAYALPNMFHYLDCPEITSTTNPLEGYFGRLKMRYRQHRGLSPEHCRACSSRHCRSL